MDEDKLKRHLNCTIIHREYEEKKQKQAAHQALLNQFKMTRESAERARLAFEGTRSSDITDEDYELRKGWTKVMYATGTAINRSDAFRPFIERTTDLSLTHSSNLAEPRPWNSLRTSATILSSIKAMTISSMG